jgi:hypothetical protein
MPRDDVESCAVILIVSDATDVHTRLVMGRLAELGVPCARYSLEEMPHFSRLGAWISNDAPPRVRIRRERGDIDLDDVRTVWCRRITDVYPDPTLSAEDRAFAAKEATVLMFGLASVLGDRFWVNPFVNALATDRGHGKVSQLEVARQLGFAIPKTLATNDPDAAREFLSGLTGGAIYKPFVAPTRSVAAEGEPAQWGTIYTNKLDDAALAALDGVAVAPCLFQELVPKRLELRVNVIGERVFATEIHSQVHAEAAIDFRRHYALGETPYAIHELPPALAEQCIALNRKLGLVYGAMDFVLTPDGRYVFLEVNQQGQFLWLEAQTGQPLLEHFCELLRQGRADYQCDAGPHEVRPLPAVPPLDPRDVVV